MSSTLCKDYLVQQFPNTATREWKRTGKKTVDSITRREFTHPDIGQCVVFTGPYGVFGGDTSMDIHDVLDGMITESDLPLLLFGGGSTTIPAGSSSEDSLLTILHHGIDWSSPCRVVLSDLHQSIDWSVLTEKAPDIHQIIVNSLFRDFLMTQDEDQDEISLFFLKPEATDRIFVTNTLGDYRLLIQAYEINKTHPRGLKGIAPLLISLEEFRFSLDEWEWDIDAVTRKYIHDTLTGIITLLLPYVEK